MAKIPSDLSPEDFLAPAAAADEDDEAAAAALAKVFFSILFMTVAIIC